MMTWTWLRRLLGWGEPNAEQAHQLLLQQLPGLRERFFQAAAASGKPRGLRWKAIEWESLLELARDRQTGTLTALVGVTIQFEAIPGSDMEDLPAVGNLRNASAVFFFDRGAWQTTGKAIFNLNPDEVIAHFGKQYERVVLTSGPAGEAPGGGNR
jgi:hypothetical protein